MRSGLSETAGATAEIDLSLQARDPLRRQSLFIQFNILVLASLAARSRLANAM
jgi:hypothetical protein